MATIMVVDDDAHIRELVSHYLKVEGFEVIEASDGEEALALLDSAKADLVVMDVMMPNMDGWELCAEIRDHYDLPRLMLTAKGETTQKLKGFELGADDYLVKPFEPLELIARVKALLKRYRISSSQSVQVGELTLDKKTYVVTSNGQSMTLPLKEFELLMQRISAFTVNLSVNLEPVYGIVLALIFFKDSEHMSTGFYFGAVLILGSVFAHALIERYLARRRPGTIIPPAIPGSVPGSPDM